MMSYAITVDLVASSIFVGHLRRFTRQTHRTSPLINVFLVFFFHWNFIFKSNYRFFHHCYLHRLIALVANALVIASTTHTKKPRQMCIILPFQLCSFVRDSNKKRLWCFVIISIWETSNVHTRFGPALVATIQNTQIKHIAHNANSRWLIIKFNWKFLAISIHALDLKMPAIFPVQLNAVLFICFLVKSSDIHRRTSTFNWTVDCIVRAIRKLRTFHQFVLRSFWPHMLIAAKWIAKATSEDVDFRWAFLITGHFMAHQPNERTNIW